MSAGHFMALDAVLMAAVGLDLIRTLRTGRARGKGGTITRERRPERFRRYVYGDWAVLGLCVVGFFWALIWPESL